MKGRGMWITRRQMGWLVILLAVLPLLPTAMMLRLMLDKAERDRDDTIRAETSVYRDQLAHLIEQSTLGDALAEKLARLPAADSAGREQAQADALADHLITIFGSEVSLSIHAPDGTTLRQLGEPPGRLAVVRQIGRGDFRHWQVAVDGIIDVPDEAEALIEATWWRAAGVALGVTVVAGVVWFGVHRGLQVNEIRGDLLTTVSHEMKTPLASMRVLLETLTDDEQQVLKTETDRRDYLALVLRENERLTRLADDFLTFARLERGEVRLALRTCSLPAILHDVIEELEPVIRAAGASIEVNLDSAPPVRADRDALTGIVRNLIENALKYGSGSDGSPPQIVVEAAHEAPLRVRLRVRDFGPGVPREYRRLVFRRYFRADERLAGDGSGVGLGLAICRQFVRRMGGKIGIEAIPSADGPGAAFYVLLPVAMPTVAPQASPDADDPAAPDASEALTTNRSSA